MNWRVKAAILRLAAAMPENLTEPAYYFLQRRYGGLRSPLNPEGDIEMASRIARRAVQHGLQLEGAKVLEIGTGRRLVAPLALWLCGVKECITVDLHSYLRPKLVQEDIAWMLTHEDRVLTILGDLVRPKQLKANLRRLESATDFSDTTNLIGLRYEAPCDAASMPWIASGSMDISLSVAVLEHVTPQALTGIIRETGRVLKPSGLAIHHITTEDHFWREGVHRAHFLQYEDHTWNTIASNRYAYVNRLREDDYRQIFERAGINVLEWTRDIDPAILAELKGGFQVAARFGNKTPETNATIHIDMVGRP